MPQRRREHFPEPSEKAIQTACLGLWRACGVKGSLVAAVPNAGARGQPGLTKGLFDLIVFSSALGDKTGWLELKTKTGKLSQAQREFKIVMIARGVPYAVSYGLDEAIRVLEHWGAVRPQARAAA
jgi:hypothetical protein